MEHLYIETHEGQQLIKLKRNGSIVAGITLEGAFITIEGATDGLTDDEWIELLRLDPNKD